MPSASERIGSVLIADDK